MKVIFFKKSDLAGDIEELYVPVNNIQALTHRDDDGEEEYLLDLPKGVLKLTSNGYLKVARYLEMNLLNITDYEEVEE